MRIDGNTLRNAIQMVRNNADAITEMEKADAAAVKQQAAEAARIAGLRAKVALALEERTQAIVNDFVALEQEAIHAAAEALARRQLEASHGLVPVAVAARIQAPVRLSRSLVDAARNRLDAAAPVSYDRQGRSANQMRSDQQRAASEALEALDPPPALSRAQAEAAAAERRAEMERARVARVARGKAEARAAGLLPADKPAKS